jgi:hypothetical protein
MSTQTIVTPGGSIGDLVEPPDVEAAEQRRLEAVEAVKARQARLDLCNRSREGFNVGLKECRIKRLETQTAVAHELINCGGPAFEADGIALGLETIRRFDERAQIFLFALKIVTELEIPRALAELRRAEADLKIAGANVIDARRWARLRAHSAALEKLTDSEGDTEVKPARFTEEGVVANEMREEGMRFFEQAEEIERTLKGK